MAKRSAQQHWVALGDVLAGQQRGALAQVLPPQLWRGWERVVGAAVQRHASPRELKRGVLTINVSNAAWMQELSYMKEQILHRLRNDVPHLSIKKLRFQVGPVLPPTPTSPHDVVAPRELSADEQEFIEQAAAQAKDPELAHAITRAMQRYFSQR